MSRSGTPRLLLVRFGAIGNALVAVPAIRALRAKWPEAYIALVADPLGLELLGPCPYLDELFRYDRRGPEAAGRGYLALIRELRRRDFTHSIHFSRRLRSELIGFLGGARTRVGFKTSEAVQWLTMKAADEKGVSVIELNLRLVRALGVEAADRRLEYWPRGSQAVDRAIAAASGSGPLVVMHPAGVTQAGRPWHGYGTVAELLRERLSARVAMIGAAGERSRVEAAAAGLEPAPALCLGLPLPEVAELIRRADLFLGADSGPAHLADAVGTPGAIVYAPHRGLAAQLRKWKPEGPRYLAFVPSRDCAACGEYRCPPDREQRCANEIDPEEVAKGLETLYAETIGRR